MTVDNIVEAIFRRLCRGNELNESKRTELVRRELCARRRWNNLERLLQCYADHWNVSACWWFRKREGRWVFGRLIISGVATYLAALGYYGLGIPLASYLGLDLLIYNTALVFKHDPRPLSIMRSNLFTLVSYASLAIAFAPFWLWLHEGFQGTPWNRSLDAAWQSIRTLTTAGPDVYLCRPAKILAAVESLVGIYFLSIVVAGYISWLGKGETR